MTFDQMHNEYKARYDNAMYGDDESKNLLGMLEKATGLSEAGKAEFVKAFSFEDAMEGELVIRRRLAESDFPNLMREHAALDITVVLR